MPRVTRAELEALAARATVLRPAARLIAAIARPRRERDIQRAILDYLNAQPGIYAWKAGAGLLPLADGRRVRMGRAGVADIVGWMRVHRGRFAPWQRCGDLRCERGHAPLWIAVEVKRPGGKPPTPLQLDFLSRLREAGSPLAMVARSVDEVRRAVESAC